MDGMFWLNVAGFFTLIGLSAFFAGAETVLTAVSRARMHALESDGNPRAKLVIRLRETKEKMIGGLLLGNTLSHVAASVLATSILIKLFGETGMVYATVIVSSMVLIFGEVMPKTYAMMHADRLALLIAPLVSFLLKLFWPVIYTVEKLVHGTFNVFGMNHTKCMAGSH
jgi:Mg2+/Co2+ transporter CorB